MKRSNLAYRVNTFIEYDENIVLKYSITINTVQFVCDSSFLCDRFKSIFTESCSGSPNLKSTFFFFLLMDGKTWATKSFLLDLETTRPTFAFGWNIIICGCYIRFCVTFLWQSFFLSVVVHWIQGINVKLLSYVEWCKSVQERLKY